MRDDPGIVGLVVDRITRGPLQGAAVTLRPLSEDTVALPPDTLPALPPVLTDPSGRFVFQGIADGRYRIEVERIGYRTVAESIDYRAALGKRVDVGMVQEAVELEPLLVVADARSFHLDATGFYDRRRRGLGRFVTRDELLAATTLRVSDVFRTMPGVGMGGGRPGSGEQVVVLRNGCRADVYVDGVHLAPPAPIDALLTPHDVDALEIYHASEVPPAFRTTGCGAVVIWTHVPDPGSVGNPFSWKRVLAAVSFVGAAILLTR